ncbi:glycosyltransferase family 25 protein [Ruegeria arenilitoris]|uniref:glycosyltransferase family 25 protein n=1 Tax=Ruegeria arenilitoris TaxID=1173585 RepID=UPI001479B9E7|nr:glycosyltransferase family 25 protein [Ruegeria arenilitoris]
MANKAARDAKGLPVQITQQMAGDSVYYINLDRVPERRAFMEAQFLKAGLVGAHRISATDASQSGALEQNGYIAGTGTRWGLTTSEIACFESHRSVWQRIADRNLPAAVVFEDDVEMSSEAGRVIIEVLNHPEAYDCVKLDYSPRSLRFGPETGIGNVRVRPMLEMAPSAAAYVLSQVGCRKLLAWSQRYSDHLDDFLSLPRRDWNMFQCFPAVGVQMIWSGRQEQIDEPVKSSERTQSAATNSGLDKGPTWFRLRRELQSAGRKLKWKLGGQARLLQRGGMVDFIPCADDLIVRPWS